MLKLETNLCENKLSLIGKLTLELKKNHHAFTLFLFFFWKVPKEKYAFYKRFSIQDLKL